MKGTFFSFPTIDGGEEFTWFGSFDENPSLSCHMFYRNDNGS
jgi:hypothetical protein